MFRTTGIVSLDRSLVSCLPLFAIGFLLARYRALFRTHIALTGSGLIALALVLASLGLSSHDLITQAAMATGVSHQKTIAKSRPGRSVFCYLRHQHNFGNNPSNLRPTFPDCQTRVGATPVQKTY